MSKPDSNATSVGEGLNPGRREFGKPDMRRAGEESFVVIRDFDFERADAACGFAFYEGEVICVVFDERVENEAREGL